MLLFCLPCTTYGVSSLCDSRLLKWSEYGMGVTLLGEKKVVRGQRQDSVWKLPTPGIFESVWRTRVLKGGRFGYLGMGLTLSQCVYIYFVYFMDLVRGYGVESVLWKEWMFITILYLLCITLYICIIMVPEMGCRLFINLTTAKTTYHSDIKALRCY